MRSKAVFEDETRRKNAENTQKTPVLRAFWDGEIPPSATNGSRLDSNLKVNLQALNVVVTV